ncbi:hypothetical protein BC826DRAFT_965629 [Russula brevipes]|nr:hypothetical protein BC826DRAFT_965629 [Russula brevipes]
MFKLRVWADSIVVMAFIDFMQKLTGTQAMELPIEEKVESANKDAPALSTPRPSSPAEDVRASRAKVNGSSFNERADADQEFPMTVSGFRPAALKARSLRRRSTVRARRRALCHDNSVPPSVPSWSDKSALSAEAANGGATAEESFEWRTRSERTN